MVNDVDNTSAPVSGIEGKEPTSTNTALEHDVDQVTNDLNISADDLASAEEYAKTLSLADTKKVLEQVISMHQNDHNFPVTVLERMEQFLTNEEVFANPEAHENLIHEMKIEAALIHNNSPYAEVRAVVDNTDDPTMHSSTIRAWVIGTLFVMGGAFVNQMFNIRQPTILIEANVAQLLSYPLGKAWEKTFPDWRFTVFGNEISLNPGAFSKKEHMLITIMANVGFNIPYTNYLVWTQYLPIYFNQKYAGSFAYQILIALGSNFIGYGVAGICRRFLVYPVHCIWPTSLVTIALNSSFYDDKNTPVMGPFKQMFTASRQRCFFICFAAMFVYFWFPNYIFHALSFFNWMSWIAPDNVNLNAVTGMVNGLGINPFPTFDWNVLLFIEGNSPLVLPFFYWANVFAGMLLVCPLILGLWFSNIWHTGHLPLMTNRVFDHFGHEYNVSRAIDARGMFSADKYAAYSPAYISAGFAVLYGAFFASYTATFTHAYLYHRHTIWRGLKALFARNPRSTTYPDIHNRLMAAYPEASERWYLAILVFAIGCSIGGISGWPTYTSPACVFYGIALCLLFVLPVGLVTATTGLEVKLNVIAEFVGGSFVAGNALAMNYFKTFGYITTTHALLFSADLKLAHYAHLPPRHTLAAQLVATAISSLVCTAVMNVQMTRIPGVCTADQPDHFSCPGINSMFTASVLWGTVGPAKVFGAGGTYSWLLAGFAVGVVVPVGVWCAQKKWPGVRWLRGVHPVCVVAGPTLMAPYNISYMWPTVPVAWLSYVWLKTRYTAFWAKYNYVVSAAFSAGIAIAAIIIFFALQWTSVELKWWGNEVSFRGCEGKPCVKYTLAEGEYFGPRIGEFH